jgi:hypothetical protein
MNAIRHAPFSDLNANFGDICRRCWAKTWDGATKFVHDLPVAAEEIECNMFAS